MRTCSFACCLFLLLAAPGRAVSAPTEPKAQFDLQGFIDGELRAGKKRIVIPPGRYPVTPRHQRHLALRDLHDVEIAADGVEMACTETTQAVSITNCRNVTLRGLVIDYDPLPFTQGRITGFSADKGVHEIELFDGYPPAAAARAFKYEIFRPDTRTLRCDDRYPGRVEVIDARHLRVIHPGGRASDEEQVGDLVVLGAEHAPHGSAPHAVELNRCVNLRLENIRLYSSNCFGFLELNCEGSTYYRCKIDRRAAADDPVRRASPRLRSLNADAFHSKHAVKGPAYIECTARFMGDDCINICGDYHMVMGSSGKRLRVLAKQGMNIQAGDPVELVQYDGLRLPNAQAVAIERAGTIRDEERSFLARQKMNDDFRRGRGGALNSAYTITLDREVEMPMGGVICAANRVGSGFAVRGCTFGYNRSRGILIKASHGEVAGNHLQGCRMSAILVTPEYWWLEAGSSSDVKIVDNTILDCHLTAICVEAPAGNGTVSPAGDHQNITIRGNRVQGSPSPGIRVTSTRGLTIEHNAMDLSDADRGPRGGKKREAIEVLHCER
jgi:hypothetical protein